MRSALELVLARRPLGNPLLPGSCPVQLIGVTAPLAKARGMRWMKHRKNSYYDDPPFRRTSQARIAASDDFHEPPTGVQYCNDLARAACNLPELFRSSVNA